MTGAHGLAYKPLDFTRKEKEHFARKAREEKEEEKFTRSE
jgi:hypothetical protein